MKDRCAALKTAVSLEPKKHHEEEGVRVAIRPEVGEEIEFFDIDDQPKARVRAFFAVEGKLADVLVLRRPRREPKRQAMVVELKSGTHWSRALKQLGAAIATLRGCLERRFDVDRWAAIVVLAGGQAPHSRHPERVAFVKRYGARLSIVSSAQCDLRRVLKELDW